MPESDLKLVKTCQNCVRAKIRCLRTPGVSSCDRCRRLNKECYFRPTRSRHHPAKKDARMEALEAKVEQLIAQSGPRLNYPPSSFHSPITPDSEQPSDASPQDVIGRGIVPFEEANAMLEKFRRTMIPHFPFVVLSPVMTLPRMREEKPFLLIAILMVSSSNRAASRNVLERVFKETIAERLIFTHSHSLDILQGLLVAQAWAQHHSDWISCSTNLHLARSIIGDLQFDKLSETETTCSRITMNECVARTEASPLSLINEKKRAVIGCLMLFSCLSTILQKNHAKTRLPYVDRYARELAQAPEYPSDAWLVHIVRLQNIMERVDEAVAVTSNADAGTVIQGFHSEIDAYKAGLPATMNNNIIVQIHLYTLELFVCQAFLFDKNSSTPFPILSSKPQALDSCPLHRPSSNSGMNLAPSQLELLARGLTAAKGVLNFFLSQSPDIDRRLSYMQWLQSGSNLVLACKLAVTASNYASHNAHIKSLCSTLDMPKVLRGMLQRVHGLNESQEQVDGKPTVRSFYVQWIERIYTWFEQRYHSGKLEQPNRIPQGLPDGSDSSSSYSRDALSWDAAPMHGQYNENVPQHGGVGEWPDFFWNVTMEEILNGPIDFMNMPFDVNEAWM